MVCRVSVWAFKVWTWEPFPDTSLVRPMLKHLKQKGISTHARALGFQKDGWSCGYMNPCIFVTRLAISEAWKALILFWRLCRKDSSSRHCASSMQLRLSPRHHPENGWEEGVSLWKPGESHPAPASNSESPPPSTSPLFFDEEDPLLQPEGTSSSEQKARESPTYLASNCEDVPPHGQPVKGHVGAPPTISQSSDSYNPPHVMTPVHMCSSVGSDLRSPRRIQRA